MVQELPRPAPGAVVRVRGGCWRVEDVTEYEDCALCLLAGTRGAERGRRKALLLPFDRPVPASPGERPARAGRAAWVGAFRRRLLDATPAMGLRAAASARFDLLPYQLEPALACLRGETRLLLADEVGLGKTVQASLVLAERFARHEAARALVLAPAGLCAQWVSELSARFDLPATHVDAAALRRLAAISPPDVTPWQQVALAVTSFDFLKQPEVMAGLGELRWDAVVVDEAHMVAMAPERGRLVRRLAARARHLLLLTATPHAADSEGFRALCDLGRLAGDPPIVVFRRSRASLGLRATRRAVVLRVRLTERERRMHEALERYTQAVWRESSREGPSASARLAMIVLRKRAASGAAPLQASVSRRLHWLTRLPSPPSADGAQLLLPLETDEEWADEEPGEVLGAPGLRDPEAERRRLANLLRLAGAARADDSKWNAIRRLLSRTVDPAIIFTEYRDTLNELAGLARRLATVAVLHGGMDQDERRESLAAFTSGRARLLLATDAAAHGLNLQARCRLVVNLELPWVPARLEQRIGRVDRIGQHRRVHAVHLVARQTAEEQVLARLVLRIARERAALGYADNPVGQIAEMEMARLVFGDHSDLAPPARALPDDETSCRRLSLEDSAAVEKDRLERSRLLAAANERTTRRRDDRRLPLARIFWTVLRRRRQMAGLPPGIICIFVARFIDDRGSLVEDMSLALHVRLRVDLLPVATLTGRMPVLLGACRPALDRLAASLALGRLQALREQVDSRVAPLVNREAAMGAATPLPRVPVQAGLFDRRALKAADEERRRHDREAADTQARLKSLARARSIELAGDPQLVLVLGVGY